MPICGRAEMKKKTKDNAVLLATEEVYAAGEEVEEHGGSYASYERLCGAMSAACKAYADQLITSSLKPQVPIQPFPFQAAEILHGLLEDLLAGRLNPMARSLVERSGARGLSMWERNAVQAACKYMQAAKKGWIADHREVAQIAERYGVNRATAQSWHRNEKRDLLPSIEDDRAREIVASMITTSMLEWAEHYSRLKQQGL
jgi:hypothetical protein